MEKTILLIDDDPDEFEIFSEALKRVAAFNDLTQVKSAAEALLWLKGNQPDFIFIDFDLPEVNGIQCLEKIKKSKKLDHTHCILYSNYIDDEMNTKALSTGASACIKKPYFTGLLATKLKEIFAEFVRIDDNNMSQTK